MSGSSARLETRDTIVIHLANQYLRKSDHTVFTLDNVKDVEIFDVDTDSNAIINIEITTDDDALKPSVSFHHIGGVYPYKSLTGLTVETFMYTLLSNINSCIRDEGLNESTEKLTPEDMFYIWQCFASLVVQVNRYIFKKYIYDEQSAVFGSEIEAKKFARAAWMDFTLRSESDLLGLDVDASTGDKQTSLWYLDFTPENTQTRPTCFVLNTNSFGDSDEAAGADGNPYNFGTELANITVTDHRIRRPFTPGNTADSTLTTLWGDRGQSPGSAVWQRSFFFDINILLSPLGAWPDSANSALREDSKINYRSLFNIPGVGGSERSVSNTAQILIPSMGMLSHKLAAVIEKQIIDPYPTDDPGIGYIPFRQWDTLVGQPARDAYPNVKMPHTLKEFETITNARLTKEFEGGVFQATDYIDPSTGRLITSATAPALSIFTNRFAQQHDETKYANFAQHMEQESYGFAVQPQSDNPTSNLSNVLPEGLTFFNIFKNGFMNVYSDSEGVVEFTATPAGGELHPWTEFVENLQNKYLKVSGRWQGQAVVDYALGVNGAGGIAQPPGPVPDPPLPDFSGLPEWPTNPFALEDYAVFVVVQDLQGNGQLYSGELAVTPEQESTINSITGIPSNQADPGLKVFLLEYFLGPAQGGAFFDNARNVGDLVAGTGTNYEALATEMLTAARANEAITELIEGAINTVRGEGTIPARLVPLLLWFARAYPEELFLQIVEQVRQFWESEVLSTNGDIDVAFNTLVTSIQIVYPFLIEWRSANFDDEGNFEPTLALPPSTPTDQDTNFTEDDSRFTDRTYTGLSGEQLADAKTSISGYLLDANIAFSVDSETAGVKKLRMLLGLGVSTSNSWLQTGTTGMYGEKKTPVETRIQGFDRDAFDDLKLAIGNINNISLTSWVNFGSTKMTVKQWLLNYYLKLIFTGYYWDEVREMYNEFALAAIYNSLEQIFNRRGVEADGEADGPPGDWNYNFLNDMVNIFSAMNKIFDVEEDLLSSSGNPQPIPAFSSDFNNINLGLMMSLFGVKRDATVVPWTKGIDFFNSIIIENQRESDVGDELNLLVYANYANYIQLLVVLTSGLKSYKGFPLLAGIPGNNLAVGTITNLEIIQLIFDNTTTEKLQELGFAAPDGTQSADTIDLTMTGIYKVKTIVQILYQLDRLRVLTNNNPYMSDDGDKWFIKLEQVTPEVLDMVHTWALENSVLSVVGETVDLTKTLSLHLVSTFFRSSSALELVRDDLGQSLPETKVQFSPIFSYFTPAGPDDAVYVYGNERIETSMIGDVSKVRNAIEIASKILERGFDQGDGTVSASSASYPTLLDDEIDDDLDMRDKLYSDLNALHDFWIAALGQPNAANPEFVSLNELTDNKAITHNIYAPGLIFERRSYPFFFPVLISRYSKSLLTVPFVQDVILDNIKHSGDEQTSRGDELTFDKKLELLGVYKEMVGSDDDIDSVATSNVQTITRPAGEIALNQLKFVNNFPLLRETVIRDIYNVKGDGNGGERTYGSGAEAKITGLNYSPDGNSEGLGIGSTGLTAGAGDQPKGLSMPYFDKYFDYNAYIADDSIDKVDAFKMWLYHMYFLKLIVAVEEIDAEQGSGLKYIFDIEEPYNFLQQMKTLITSDLMWDGDGITDELNSWANVYMNSYLSTFFIRDSFTWINDIIGNLVTDPVGIAQRTNDIIGVSLGASIQDYFPDYIINPGDEPNKALNIKMWTDAQTQFDEAIIEPLLNSITALNKKYIYDSGKLLYENASLQQSSVSNNLNFFATDDISQLNHLTGGVKAILIEYVMLGLNARQYDWYQQFRKNEFRDLPYFMQILQLYANNKVYLDKNSGYALYNSDNKFVGNKGRAGPTGTIKEVADEDEYIIDIDTFDEFVVFLFFRPLQLLSSGSEEDDDFFKNIEMLTDLNMDRYKNNYPNATLSKQVSILRRFMKEGIILRNRRDYEENTFEKTLTDIRIKMAGLSAPVNNEIKITINNELIKLFTSEFKDTINVDGNNTTSDALIKTFVPNTISKYSGSSVVNDIVKNYFEGTFELITLMNAIAISDNNRNFNLSQSDLTSLLQHIQRLDEGIKSDSSQNINEEKSGVQFVNIANKTVLNRNICEILSRITSDVINENKRVNNNVKTGLTANFGYGLRAPTLVEIFRSTIIVLANSLSENIFDNESLNDPLLAFAYKASLGGGILSDLKGTTPGDEDGAAELFTETVKDILRYENRFIIGNLVPFLNLRKTGEIDESILVGSPYNGEQLDEALIKLLDSYYPSGEISDIPSSNEDDATNKEASPLVEIINRFKMIVFSVTLFVRKHLDDLNLINEINKADKENLPSNVVLTDFEELKSRELQRIVERILKPRNTPLENETIKQLNPILLSGSENSLNNTEFNQIKDNYSPSSDWNDSKFSGNGSEFLYNRIWGALSEIRSNPTRYLISSNFDYDYGAPMTEHLYLYKVNADDLGLDDNENVDIKLRLCGSSILLSNLINMEGANGTINNKPNIKKLPLHQFLIALDLGGRAVGYQGIFNFIDTLSNIYSDVRNNAAEEDRGRRKRILRLLAVNLITYIDDLRDVVPYFREIELGSSLRNFMLSINTKYTDLNNPKCLAIGCPVDVRDVIAHSESDVSMIMQVLTSFYTVDSPGIRVGGMYGSPEREWPIGTYPVPEYNYPISGKVYKQIVPFFLLNESEAWEKFDALSENVFPFFGRGRRIRASRGMKKMMGNVLRYRDNVKAGHDLKQISKQIVADMMVQFEFVVDGDGAPKFPYSVATEGPVPVWDHYGGGSGAVYVGKPVWDQYGGGPVWDQYGGGPGGFPFFPIGEGGDVTFDQIKILLNALNYAPPPVEKKSLIGALPELYGEEDYKFYYAGISNAGRSFGAGGQIPLTNLVADLANVVNTEVSDFKRDAEREEAGIDTRLAPIADAVETVTDIIGKLRGESDENEDDGQSVAGLSDTEGDFAVTYDGLIKDEGDDAIEMVIENENDPWV